jgi:formylglycine-generating enzyme required for sulfatase activity
MSNKKNNFFKKISLKKYFYLLSFTIGILFVISFNKFLDITSTNEFCESCHVHPQAEQSWRLGNHYDNSSGVIVKCVDCHLPPGGIEYLIAKTSTGVRDIYGTMFKNTDEIDWEIKSGREAAIYHTFKSGCVKCHQNLFPRTLSKKGEDAHLYYDSKPEELRCINCHLETGHYHEPAEIAEPDITAASGQTLFKEAAIVTKFEDFEETLPNSMVSFRMISIPEGTFLIGTPEDESFRKDDEGPQKEIKLSKFWMGETEVTWDEYQLFLKETGVQGRTEDQVSATVSNNSIDAISGPTPPYGNPGQGWGKGKRPAITMTHSAAVKYCEWLSTKTGKKYRLPTEAEWEYACRSGRSSPYFFEGDPSSYSETGFWNGIFGFDTTIINSYVIYKSNSNGRTAEPHLVLANPLGLKNMSGNVKEFCSDWYTSDYYNSLTDGVENPSGPAAGEERVVRGGSFKSDAADVRSGRRAHTSHDKWMLTDPQIPKSIWWYSDCNDVGFRVVCEYDEKLFSN